MKYFVFILLFFIVSCVTIKNRHDVLALNTIGNSEGILKTEGYYYRELERQAYPYYKNKYGGFSQDSSRPYTQKLIEPLILYKDGWVEKYHLFSGMKENYANQAACGLVDNNSVFFAKLYFECRLNRDEKPDSSILGMLFNKGVFKTQQNQIIVQYYECYGLPMDAEYYLIEKRGEIINDTTFVLKSMCNFRTKEFTACNNIYTYQACAVKPALNNYISNHKKKFNHK